MHAMPDLSAVATELHDEAEAREARPFPRALSALFGEFHRANAAARRYEGLKCNLVDRAGVAGNGITGLVFEEFYAGIRPGRP